ncbi:MAG: MarR family transcriptional regulator [Bacteroidia bacterium]|nr:MarR family transcriptional regulator [Bacteroidia bacterium]
MTTAHELALTLQRLGYLLREMEWNQASKSGISPLQRQILSFIRAFPTRARASYLTRYLGLKKPTISLALKQLEQKGLIRRQVDPSNRRSYIIHLTPAGEKLSDWLELGTLEQWLAEMPPETQENLKSSLYALMSHLTRHQAAAEIYLCDTCRWFISSSHYCEAQGKYLEPKDMRLICPTHSLLNNP